MLRLQASLYLFTAEENGASKDGFSGMRPSFGFDNELITSEIRALGGFDSVFPRGAFSIVEIRLPYGDVFEESIRPGMHFGVNVGGWQVGHGTVEKVLEIFRDPRNQEIIEEVQAKRNTDK